MQHIAPLLLVNLRQQPIHACPAPGHKDEIRVQIGILQLQKASVIRPMLAVHDD